MSPISLLIKVGVNWSWRERSLVQSSHTSHGDNHIARESSAYRSLATRDYRQVVYPGCEKFTVDKFTVDNKMLADI